MLAIMKNYVKHSDFKTILVDAIHTLYIPEHGFDQKMVNILKRYKNPIIITTNMKLDDLEKHPLLGLGYQIFTREGDPNKRDPEYWKKLLDHYGLTINDVIAFDHNPEVKESAYDAGVVTQLIEPYAERDHAAIQGLFDTYFTLMDGFVENEPVI